MAQELFIQWASAVLKISHHSSLLGSCLCREALLWDNEMQPAVSETRERAWSGRWMNMCSQCRWQMHGGAQKSSALPPPSCCVPQNTLLSRAPLDITRLTPTVPRQTDTFVPTCGTTSSSLGLSVSNYEETWAIIVHMILSIIYSIIYLVQC